jgi:hypothetical protein
MVAALRALKTTHILWNSDFLTNGGAGNEPPHIEEAMAAGSVKLIYEARGYRVYELTEAGR